MNHAGKQNLYLGNLTRNLYTAFCGLFFHIYYPLIQAEANGSCGHRGERGCVGFMKRKDPFFGVHFASKLITLAKTIQKGPILKTE